MWQTLIGPIANVATKFLHNRAELKAAQHERKLTAINHSAEWESQMAQASATSWKDEWFTLLLSVPLLAIGWGVVVDDPDIIKRVEDGFLALQALPEFYHYLLFIAVTASFGVRGVDKIMSLRK